MELLVILTLLVVGYSTGRLFETRHYKSIFERESQLKSIPLISGPWRGQIEPDEEGQLMGGGVVMGSDYFKTFANNLRNIIGGRMKNYESLIDRARREAMLRLKEKSAQWGAEKIVNVKIETANIGGGGANGRGLPCVEIFAYGTAIKKKN